MPGGLAETFSQVRRGEWELAGLLPTTQIDAALHDAGYVERGRVYTGVATVLAFLGQALGADRSCRQAVGSLCAQRAASRQAACSADTGGYCKARQRLPEAAFWQWQRQTGQCVEEQAGREALWRGRRVRVVDGSTEKIAETAANCAEYPRQRGQRPGASYPVVRVLVVFSLAVGTVLEALMRPYQGKGTGETSMLRELASCFASGDVLLGDRYFAGYWDLAFWGRRGVDVVTRAPVSRRSDFRRGKRLGKDDHLIVWKRGQRPDWVTADEAAEFPRTLTLREVRVRVTIPGFRTRSVVLITTLLDPASYPVSALADLYRQRWQAELNLRSLKTHLGIAHLRTKTPEMVRKEFAMHLIAYNCVRRVASEASQRTGLPASQISFQGARQTLNEFLPRLSQTNVFETWLARLLDAVARHRVGNRPNRVEPRATKQRPSDYPTLKRHRSAYKRRYHGKT